MILWLLLQPPWLRWKLCFRISCGTRWLQYQTRPLVFPSSYRLLFHRTCRLPPSPVIKWIFEYFGISFDTTIILGIAMIILYWLSYLSLHIKMKPSSFTSILQFHIWKVGLIVSDIKYNDFYSKYVNIASVLSVLQWNDFTYESPIPPQCKKMAVGYVEMWLLSNHANCLG